MKLARLEGFRVLKPVTQGETLRTMTISALRIGHPEADSDFPSLLLEHTRGLSANLRPHVLVAPELTYGDHAGKTMPVSQQGNLVGELVQELEKMGITVVDKI